MSVASLHLKCDWCEQEKTYEGDAAEEEARQDGWLSLVNDTGEFDFCGLECAIAYL